MVNTRSSSGGSGPAGNGVKRKNEEDETEREADEKKTKQLTRIEERSLDDDAYYRYVASLGPEEIRRRIGEAELLKEQLAYMRDQSIYWSRHSERKPASASSKTMVDDRRHPYKHLKWLLEARLEYVNLMLEEMEYEDADDDDEMQTTAIPNNEDDRQPKICNNSQQSQIQIPDIDSTNSNQI